MKKILLFVISSLVVTACSDDRTKVELSSQEMVPLTVETVDLSPKKGTDRWYTKEQVSEGRKVYSQFCASCHGVNAESVDSWRKLDANGNYPPPPLNGSAHAWHHPLFVMNKVIRDGGAPLGGVMPGWGAVLNEDQRLKAVASFQDYWDDETYQRWLQREKSSRQ